MSEHILPVDNFKNRFGSENCWETILSGTFAGLLENEDMLPGVEWKLVIRRAVPLVEVSLTLNFSFIPNHIASKFEPNTPKNIDYISAKNHTLLAHRREDNVILIVEIVEDIEEVYATGFQHAKHFMGRVVHVV